MGGIMNTRTELTNILRIYGLTLAAQASDLGITKSYLSKIINGRASSPKYEKLLNGRIRKLQKTKPENVNRNSPRVKYTLCSWPIGVKDIPLRNGIQAVLDERNLTVTRLAQEINEARSSVAQVIIGLRHTERIQKKIISYLNLDEIKFFNRTFGEMVSLHDGELVPLPTKETEAARKRALAEAMKGLSKNL
jgi:transcriptional regulator with XRE-family HTH domain